MLSILEPLPLNLIPNLSLIGLGISTVGSATTGSATTGSTTSPPPTMISLSAGATGVSSSNFTGVSDFAGFVTFGAIVSL